MSNIEPGVEMFAPETILKMDEDAAEVEAANASCSSSQSNNNKINTSAKQDELISMETLRESPVQWPERFPGMEEFLTASNTPIHTPNTEASQNLTSADMARINQLATLTPEQLIDKIKSMQDEIYQLGLRESKEMTRGKLLGIFDRVNKTKRNN